MIYITCPKMGDGILTSLLLGLIHVCLCLECHVIIFDGLYLVATVLSLNLTAITESFSLMVEANFRTSRGKTVSTTHSLSGSA